MHVSSMPYCLILVIFINNFYLTEDGSRRNPKTWLFCYFFNMTLQVTLFSSNWHIQNVTHIVFIKNSIYSRGGFIQDGISLKHIQNLNSG